MVKITYMPEAPRDPAIAFDAPRQVLYTTQWHLDRNGKPIGRTTLVSQDGQPAVKNEGTVRFPRRRSSA
jgi:hypothetical protein